MYALTKWFYRAENKNLRQLVEAREEDMRPYGDGLVIRKGNNEIVLSLKGERVDFHITLNEDKFNKWDQYTEVPVNPVDGVGLFVKGIEFPSGLNKEILLGSKERFKELLIRNNEKRSNLKLKLLKKTTPSNSNLS